MYMFTMRKIINKTFSNYYYWSYGVFTVAQVATRAYVCKCAHNA